MRSLAKRILSRLIFAPVGFDPEFYAEQYTDLAGLSALHRFRHYRAHGRAEGRLGSPREMMARIQAEFGPLPSGFSLTGYRRFNRDLADTIPGDFNLVVHFLKHGQHEGRSYSEFDRRFYRDLYHPDWPLDAARLDADWRAAQGQGRFGAWAEMLEAHGFAYGPWVALIQPVEFVTLNQGWLVEIGAHEVKTRAQAALAFVTGGWRRLAPLAIGAEFEPDFYRETHAELADASDADLYRNWLLEGVPVGAPGAVRDQLRQLRLAGDAYPRAFPHAAYAQLHPDAGAGRWGALQHLVANGFPAEGLGGGDDPEQAEFLEALADGFAVAGQDASAIRALEAAEKARPLAPTGRQHLGDAYFRLRLWGRALDQYAAGIERGEYTIWTVVNAVKACLQLQQADEAFHILARAKDRFEGEQAWRDSFEEAVRGRFASASFAAFAAYGAERVEAGDKALLDAVAEIAGRYQALSPLGAPVSPSPEGRVVILANQDLRQCTHYRVEQKAELFAELGRPCQIFEPSDVDGFLKALPGASAAIFYRLAALPEVIRAILTARAVGVPTYYEIDDLIFDSSVYPAPIETYGGQVSRAVYDGLRYGTPLTRAAMALCDYAIASTGPLADEMRPRVRTGEAFVIRNGLDSRNQGYLDRPPRAAPADGDPIRIFYGSGTLAHNTDFLELAGQALLELLQAYPRVRLVIVGYLVLGPAFAPFEDRIERVKFLPDARAYWSLLAEADINLAVLEPGLISDCKSEIKWLEAAVFGVPSVVSPTATYRDALVDGEDVLFAATVQDWRGALAKLVGDAALRGRIGAAARAKAAQAFSLQAGARSLAVALKAAEPAPAGRPAPAKPRVMLANVYFPPQTIGGATRVVRDNIDSWIASGVAEAFDFAVASTDHEAEPAYRSRVDAYRGLPVFRMTTPRRANMDWRPFDAEAGEIFAAYLRAWRPDLVHFHATQRLTASCLQACRQAGIPYLVTVHDAWWVSDWPFLIDEDGHLRRPMEPLLRPTSTGITLAQSRERLARLTAELNQAAAVLAVSDSFAELYRSAGVENVVSIPNGLPRLTPRPRTPSPSGRVRLGHIGSMSIHKGFHLLHAALNESRFANLELTVVDHHPRTEPEHQLWGATPVTIVGKTPQGSIQDLYANLDVLLAPSIWPESYGLVTREALASGLWVVAGDRGAIAEDVETGVNGFVVDVSDASGLKAALAQIDADPQRYLGAPERIPALRTADQQAAEIADLYRRLCGSAAAASVVQANVAEPT